ncbi:MAG: GIY-YIG nuclease family protein [Parvibaculum sp.]|uniref:GIY-YIG nuclease family protein n=1 Tax=Parvibaculum sp. TaxID=2024848 RepID=UPI0032EC0769
MHQKFEEAVNSLHESFGRLIDQRVRQNGDKWPKEKIRGVYLFSENGRHLYVGRTNNVKKRYAGHCNASSKHYSSPFAFRLAREETGKLTRSYRNDENSRAALEKDTVFAAAFAEAKDRLRAMEFRWVEEIDPVRQCLLEVYCAVALETPYNDFDNH